MVELLIGISLIAAGGGTVLYGITASQTHQDYLAQFQMAMNEAQGQLDELAASDFSLLVGGAQYAPARSNAGQAVPLTSVLPNGIMRRQIKAFPIGSANPSLLSLHVAVCWTSRGRLIGENNGQANCVDSNNDTWVTSPAMVSTRIANRS